MDESIFENEQDSADEDVEQKRAEIRDQQGEHEEPQEPDARDGAATGEGGTGF